MVFISTFLCLTVCEDQMIETYLFVDIAEAQTEEQFSHLCVFS